jgi:cytoskeleton protein RodZ
MADIGSLLRETRIRNKIDITTVEQATKIRAKYLRALENEEWVVLPGPTYVKTFLRTYAQFLGLDPHLLVEEYSARFEEPEELELPAFARRERLPERAVRRVGPPSRAKGALIALAAVVGFLFVLGLLADEDGGDSPSRDEQAPRAAQTKQADRERGERAATGDERQARRRNVRLEVVAARTVWVCVVDAEGTERVNAATMEGGDREGPFRSRSFRVTVGNGGGDLRIDGRRRDTPDRAEPIGYLVRASGTTVLPADRRPTCG